MKNSKHLMLLFALATFLAIYLSSCERHEGEPCGVPDKYFYLSDAEKKLWPLTEMDSFTLISNKGERVVYSNGRKLTNFSSENFSNGPECSWRHHYEFYDIVYQHSLSQRRSIVSLARSENSITIMPHHEKKSSFSIPLSFSIPFSYFIPSNYKYEIATNKGLIKCLAFGDSLYYSQTEGIIRFVENDSTYWTREF